MKKLLLALLLLWTASCSYAQNSNQEITHKRKQATTKDSKVATTFENPMHKGADPWVMKHDGKYYTCASGGRGIVVTESRFLTRVESQHVVWQRDTSDLAKRGIWAPEIHFFDGKWYIYYAAGSKSKPFVAQRTYVLESDKPTEGYKLLGMVNTGDDDRNSIWAIDMSIMEHNGKRYAVWSGWERQERTDNTTQNTYIAEMIAPDKLGKRVLLSRPTESWEVGPESPKLQEGQAAIHNDRGDSFILYSTRGSWTIHYCLGMLKIAKDDDPLNPSNWVKIGPVFSPSEDVWGVGHASFTTSPDDTEHWIYYHSKTSRQPGWGDRKVNLMKFTFDSSGNPVFDKPVYGTAKRPSGEVKIDRRILKERK